MKTIQNKLLMISIVKPYFNSASFVADAMNSMMDQIYKNWELIVVDDKSLDENVQIVSSFEKNRKIKLIKCSFNNGSGDARNYALRGNLYKISYGVKF